MIHILILAALSVLLEDNGHTTMAGAGYIIAGVLFIFWLIAMVTRTAPVDDGS